MAKIIPTSFVSHSTETSTRAFFLLLPSSPPALLLPTPTPSLGRRFNPFILAVTSCLRSCFGMCNLPCRPCNALRSMFLIFFGCDGIAVGWVMAAFMRSGTACCMRRMVKSSDGPISLSCTCGAVLSALFRSCTR